MVFPEVAKYIGAPILNAGGWLLGASQELKKNDDYYLYILAPSNHVNEIVTYSCEGIEYIIIPAKNYRTFYELVRKRIKPTLVHMFGTEMEHSWGIFEIFQPSEVIVSIQGIISEYERYYYADLPNDIIERKRIYELLTRDSLIKQKDFFYKRGLKEIELLKKAKYVIGRTEWDKAITQSLNPNATYLHCNETLRSRFYHLEWDINKIERHSIFISQGSNPIKGLHYAIQGLIEIKEDFPKVKLYVAGQNLLKNREFGKKWKLSSYAKYIYDLIHENHLENQVVFLGNLDEEQMCQEYLKAHVYLCSSAIENSPNSLGEAMITGTPCVASWVGGIPSMLTHEKEGYLYQHNSIKMMAHYIKKIFKSDSIAVSFSQNAQERARQTHNPQINNEQLLFHYESVLGDK